MRYIHRKFDASAVASAKRGDFLYNAPRDSSKSSVRLLYSTHDFVFQLRICCGLDSLKPPESSFQTGNWLFGKAEIDHFFDVFVAREISRLSLQKEFEISLPRRPEE